MSEQFDFSLCVCVKRTWRHVPFLSCPSSVQSRQGLSRVRIKGVQEEEKVLPQLIWLLWGEEHYSHWCSGRMAETPRTFRKGAYSRLDVTRRTGLEDGCWAYCGDGGNIVPAPLFNTALSHRLWELDGLSGCLLLLYKTPERSHVRGLVNFPQVLKRNIPVGSH